MKVENGEIKLDYGEILIRDDVFKTHQGELHLVARRCEQCGDISFPPYKHCLKCDSTDETVEKVLDNNWTLYSYTTCDMVTPGFQPGYILALMAPKDLPDVRIVAQLVDCTMNDLKQDMDMEMVPSIVQENMQGYKVVSYTFKPVQSK